MNIFSHIVYFGIWYKLRNRCHSGSFEAGDVYQMTMAERAVIAGKDRRGV